MKEWIIEYFRSGANILVDSGHFSSRIDVGLNKEQNPTLVITVVMMQYIVYGIDFLSYHQIKTRYREHHPKIEYIDPSHIVLTFMGLGQCG